MKQIIITFTLLLALGMTTEAVAQKHRHTPQTVQLTELVDSTGKDAVEAFSDTTSTSQTSAADDNWPLDDEDDTQVVKSADRLFDFVDSQMSGMLFVLAVERFLDVLQPELQLHADAVHPLGRGEDAQLALIHVRQLGAGEEQLFSEKYVRKGGAPLAEPVGLGVQQADEFVAGLPGNALAAQLAQRIQQRLVLPQRRFHLAPQDAGDDPGEGHGLGVFLAQVGQHGGHVLDEGVGGREHADVPGV